MPRITSSNYRVNLNSESGCEHPIFLLKFEHEDLLEPACITNYDKEVVSNVGLVNGPDYTFSPCPIEVTLPSDNESEQPRVQMRIASYAPLIKWIDSYSGAYGLKVRLIQIMPSTPNIVEIDLICDVREINVGMPFTTATLTYDDTLNRQSVPVAYNRRIAPGLY